MDLISLFVPRRKRRIKYQIDETQLNDGGIGFRQIKKMNATTETYKSMYDAVIEDTDERMGLIIDAFLEISQMVESMTSDHGEMIGEHERSDTKMVSIKS